MKAIDRRLHTLEERLAPGEPPQLTFFISSLYEGLIDTSRCKKVSMSAASLPTTPGLHIVTLWDLPHGLNHDEIDGWLREHGAEIATATAYKMRAINKRLEKLETRCGLGPETEEHRRWRERFEKFKQRLAAGRVNRGLPPEIPDPFPGVDRRGMTMSSYSACGIRTSNPRKCRNRRLIANLGAYR